MLHRKRMPLAGLTCNRPRPEKGRALLQAARALPPTAENSPILWVPASRPRHLSTGSPCKEALSLTRRSPAMQQQVASSPLFHPASGTFVPETSHQHPRQLSLSYLLRKHEEDRFAVKAPQKETALIEPLSGKVPLSAPEIATWRMCKTITSCMHGMSVWRDRLSSRTACETQKMRRCLRFLLKDQAKQGLPDSGGVVWRRVRLRVHLRQVRHISNVPGLKLLPSLTSVAFLNHERMV